MKPLTSLEEVWAAPSAELTLARYEVHVWRAFLDQPASSGQRLAHTLAADEQVRAGRFRSERDRLHFSVGRGVLRVILGDMWVWSRVKSSSSTVLKVNRLCQKQLAETGCVLTWLIRMAWPCMPSLVSGKLA